jgi:hypothetical protein
MMQGIMTFSNLEQALRAGFQICGHTDHGILVRSRTKSGWVLAIVDGSPRPMIHSRWGA